MRWSVPGLAGGLLWAGVSTALSAVSPPSVRIGYVTVDEALIVAEPAAALEAETGSTLTIAGRETDNPRVRHWQVTGPAAGKDPHAAPALHRR
jgi:hypothetical protein